MSVLIITRPLAAVLPKTLACAWCPPPVGGWPPGISHGICARHVAQLEAEMDAHEASKAAA